MRVKSRVRAGIIIWGTLVLLLSVSVPSASAEGHLYKWSIASAATAHVLDLWTTEACLGRHTCREVNPLLAPVSSRPAAFAVVKLGGAAVSLWATDKMQSRKMATLTNFVMTGLFTSLAIHNAQYSR